MNRRYRSNMWMILGLGLVLGLGLGTVSGPAQVQSMAITSLEELTIALYEQVVPSVVIVMTQEILRSLRFSPEPQEGLGSGFVYDTEGRIITNNHVVAGADNIEVMLSDGTTLSARIVGTDERTDLAVLQIQTAGPLIPVQLGDSSDLKPGQFALALGNPFGLDGTMTLGIISATHRTLELSKGQFLIGTLQTDAAINPGNSGGPLLDVHGRVIGINTLIFSPNGGFAGVGFAVPAETIKRVVPALIQSGRYLHPWLGIKIITLTPDIAQRIETETAADKRCV